MATKDNPMTLFRSSDKKGYPQIAAAVCSNDISALRSMGQVGGRKSAVIRKARAEENAMRRNRWAASAKYASNNFLKDD